MWLQSKVLPVVDTILVDVQHAYNGSLAMVPLPYTKKDSNKWKHMFMWSDAKKWVQCVRLDVRRLVGLLEEVSDVFLLIYKMYFWILIVIGLLEKKKH